MQNDELAEKALTIKDVQRLYKLIGQNDFIDLKMSDYQDNIYAFYENIEKKLEIKSRGQSKIYKTYTRQSSNFCFPIKGEKRPRPGMFKLSTKEGLVVDEGKNKSKIETA
jgi:hypothetical protein